MSQDELINLLKLFLFCFYRVVEAIHLALLWLAKPAGCEIASVKLTQ